jgi:pimeloyl-ACP methyl ester carboxylesterase
VLPSITAVAWSVGGWQVSRSDGYGRSYDWSKDVPAIKAPTLLVFGYADAVRTAHAVQFFELLGGGKKDGSWDGSGISNARLAILPGLTHYTLFARSMRASPSPALES